MAYPNTQSRLGSFISTSLSTQIIIEVDNQKVGGIQNMTINQNRPIERVSEVGFDGILEALPNQPATVDLSVERIVFDGLSLPLAFGRPFHNIKSQRIPFIIKVYDRMYAQSTTGAPDFDADATDPGMIIHEYQGCWFKSLSQSYTSNNYIISQNADIVCEDVVTYFANGTTTPAIPAGFPSGYPGGADGELAYSIETTTDVGRRGTLDAASLGLLFGGNPFRGAGG